MLIFLRHNFFCDIKSKPSSILIENVFRRQELDTVTE